DRSACSSNERTAPSASRPRSARHSGRTSMGSSSTSPTELGGPMFRGVTILLFCVSMLAVGVRPAAATHYNGGTLSWEQDTTFPVPFQVRFSITMETYWRWSHPWSPIFPTVGTILSGQMGFVGLHYADGGSDF